jgi:hypothetical protein
MTGPERAKEDGGPIGAAYGNVALGHGATGGAYGITVVGGCMDDTGYGIIGLLWHEPLHTDMVASELDTVAGVKSARFVVLDRCVPGGANRLGRAATKSSRIRWQPSAGPSGIWAVDCK